jgi:hypothetical protein
VRNRVSKWWGGIAALALVVALASIWAADRADANEVSVHETIFATDVASAGYGGMRGDGTGQIELSGVTGTVTRAYLYWQGPTTSEDPDANAAVTFNGMAVTGTNIGFSGHNTWSGFDNSQAYRADVTSLVTGDGTYTLADFFKPDVADIDGVSLIVFFDDGDSSNDVDVVILDGNDSNASIANTYDANGWSATLAGVDYASGSASMELHVADGQFLGGFDAEPTLYLNDTPMSDEIPSSRETRRPAARRSPDFSGIS